ncbi:hypothetical protein HDV64DRAFT_220877 [Trichoderma sp. TUCIM 5745]
MKRVLRSSRYYVYVAVGLLLTSWLEGLLGLGQASIDKARVGSTTSKHMLRGINPQIYHRGRMLCELSWPSCTETV